MTPTAANNNRRLSLKELRARRGENARMMRTATGEVLDLCHEMDAVLSVLIRRLDCRKGKRNLSSAASLGCSPVGAPQPTRPRGLGGNLTPGDPSHDSI